jgi:16S rRNA (guanine(966)-N(2))-methyltransferase RsmD
MRVIAGTFKSRRLKGTPPAGVRPTSDKLRETLFNILGSSVRNCVFLDGFAGVGAVGIEAISRGARHTCFVDQSRKSMALVRENLRSLGVGEGFRLMESPLDQALDVLERENVQVDIAFIDPPYDRGDLYKAVLNAFGTRPLLANEGILVAEHSRRVDLPDHAGKLRRYRILTQGDSSLSFFKIEEM